MGLFDNEILKLFKQVDVIEKKMALVEKDAVLLWNKNFEEGGNCRVNAAQGAKLLKIDVNRFLMFVKLCGVWDHRHRRTVTAWKFTGGSITQPKVETPVEDPRQNSFDLWRDTRIDKNSGVQELIDVSTSLINNEAVENLPQIEGEVEDENCSDE